jgi:enoyl-CoA hydratase/carnithine racemase
MSKATFEQRGDLGEMVISDPPLNLVDLELAADLGAAIEQAAQSSARAILVRAEGDNFSAGANVEMFLDRDEHAARELLEGFIGMLRRFESLPVPTVCAVQGLCLAAGLELALACDLIWASDDCNLGLVEAVIGATPFGGGTQRLTARAGAGRALEAVLTGRPYPAATMLEWGVVNRVLPRAELEPKTRAFAERLAAGPTVAHAATKRIVHAALNDGVEAADAALPAEGARVMASEDLQAGARTLLAEGPGKAKFQGR